VKQVSALLSTSHWQEANTHVVRLAGAVVGGKLVADLLRVRFLALGLHVASGVVGFAVKHVAEVLARRLLRVGLEAVASGTRYYVYGGGAYL
jgi:hypothetical protein